MFAFALGTAFFEALKDIVSKHSFATHSIDSKLVAWAIVTVTVPMLVPFVFAEGLPAFGGQYWLILGIAAPLHVLCWLLYLRAIETSALGEATPMVMFTPIFMLFTGPLFVDEDVSQLGLLGILLIVAGSYLLNIRGSGKGIFTPFLALVSKLGPRLMLVVAAVWSVTAYLDRLGIQASSTWFWGFSIYLAISALMTILMLLQQGISVFSPLRAKSGVLLGVGCMNGLSFICYLAAITSGFVVYTIAIKRLSVLLAMLAGRIWFKEKATIEKFIGAAIMIGGVFLIAYA